MVSQRIISKYTLRYKVLIREGPGYQISFRKKDGNNCEITNCFLMEKICQIKLHKILKHCCSEKAITEFPSSFPGNISVVTH